MLFTHDEKSVWYLVNGGLATIAFFICRAVPSILCTAHVAWVWLTFAPPTLPYAKWESVFAAVSLTALFLMHGVLNMVWFAKLLKHLVRNLRRAKQRVSETEGDVTDARRLGGDSHEAPVGVNNPKQRGSEPSNGHALSAKTGSGLRQRRTRVV